MSILAPRQRRAVLAFTISLMLAVAAAAVTVAFGSGVPLVHAPGATRSDAMPSGS